jgi:hypothetical protein
VPAWTYSFTEPGFGPAPPARHSGPDFGLAGLSGALNPLPGALGSGGAAVRAVVSEHASGGGSHGPGLTSLLFGNAGAQPDAWLRAFNTGPRGDLATRPLYLADAIAGLSGSDLDMLFWAADCSALPSWRENSANLPEFPVNYRLDS